MPSAALAEKPVTTTDSSVKAIVTMRLEQQRLGLVVDHVQDVVKSCSLTRVPLAHPAVAGVMNLRGRVVTAVDMRCRLGMKPLEIMPGDDLTMVVVTYRDELFGLVVDAIGDVLNLPMSRMEPPPPHLKDHWKAIAHGVYPMDDGLMVIADIERLFEF